ncbi:YcaO-like family protein [Cytobacillus solani]|uniref:YcaO-like family protein n=1 Tax=Cytobacillus solani TaxID=1637975 RepID=UPI00115004DB|nr:YcaO-like family protein [Cytobacillus solani]
MVWKEKMIFEISKGDRYGFTNKKFINKKLYQAKSLIGTFVDKDGYMAPYHCGAVSEEKGLSVKKAFSESIERRALMKGAKELKGDGTKSIVYDILRKEVQTLPIEYTKYRETPPHIDTTGTATHSNGKIAVFNAVSELLEKNSVFLLWYGKDTKKIKHNQFSSIYKDYLLFENSGIHLFLQSTFFPLFIVVAIIKCDPRYSLLKYKFGVGSSFNLDEAINKALSEAYFLGKYNEHVYFFNKYQEYDDIALTFQFEEETQNYIEDFIHLEETSSTIYTNFDLSAKEKLGYVVNNLPKWIKDLKVSILLQSVDNNLIIAKVYSESLYTHIPIKKYIDLNKDINKKYLKLKEEDFSIVPDCPII